jgi:hypothetical protein
VAKTAQDLDRINEREPIRREVVGHDRRDDQGQAPGLGRRDRRALPDGPSGATRARLDRHSVHYWVDADAISLDGKPAIVVVNFGRAGDASRIQALLDEAG